MAKAPGAEEGRHTTRPASLAEALAEMARNLAEALPGVAQDDLKKTLHGALEGMRGICSSLRSIDVLYDPEHAREFARHADGLRALALGLGEAVSDLTLANRGVAAKLDDHIDELQRIADMPSADVTARLNTTIDHVREMAAEMYQAFDAVAAKVSRATEGVAALERELRNAREQAFTDALTRVRSRSALDERLAAAVSAGDAAGPWWFALIEVDHFARVAEAHGQIVGDALLFKVARTIEAAIPEEEGKCFLARYAQEQFALILAQADATEAGAVAGAIRGGVAGARWQRRDRPERGVVRVTLSIGLAQFVPGDTVDRLVERAQRALEQARGAGGDRIVAF